MSIQIFVRHENTPKNLSSIDHMSDLFLYCHQQNLPLKMPLEVNKEKLWQTNISLKEITFGKVSTDELVLHIVIHCLSELWQIKHEMISTFDRSRIQPPAGEATLQLHCAMWRLVWVCWRRMLQCCADALSYPQFNCAEFSKSGFNKCLLYWVCHFQFSIHTSGSEIPLRAYLSCAFEKKYFCVHGSCDTQLCVRIWWSTAVEHKTNSHRQPLCVWWWLNVWSYVDGDMSMKTRVWAQLEHSLPLWWAYHESHN